MKVLFVDNFRMNFGVSQITAVLKQSGHEVELLNYKLSKWKDIDLYRRPEKYFSFDKISDEIIEREPDIIAFSVFSANYMFFKKAGESIHKKTDIPILVGGVFATLSPDFFIENSPCDYVFRGEAEPVIVELIEKVSAGKYHDVPNLVYRNGNGQAIHNKMESFVEDIDELPFYDKDLYQNLTNTLYIYTSRGCCMSCAYCSAGKYSKLLVRKGKGPVRKRNVDHVIEEIKQTLQQYPYKEVAFYDDFFITSTRWLSEFVEKYSKEIGLPYSCSAFPGRITKEIAYLLAKSGCDFVSMGFQTANDNYKKQILRRNETKSQVVRAMQNLKEHGIDCSLDHIFNLPGESREHIEESLDFYIDNKVKGVTIYFLNYYPDSFFVKYSYENGFITSEQYSKIMNNEMIGEQSFKGTITDEKKAKEQVQHALLFRLISWLPGKWVKWLFRNEIQKLFPTNRYFYYALSVITLVKLTGIHKLPLILKLNQSFSKTLKEKIRGS
jgi:radical SAM superfamily enzyme YgiQ (UPF0313 family)